MKIPSFQNFLNESKIKVKRKYTDTYPAVYVNEKNSVRWGVMKFISECENMTATHEEMVQYFKTIKESSQGKNKGTISWLRNNKKIIQKNKTNGNISYTFTKYGKKIWETYLKKIKENELNADCVDCEDELDNTIQDNEDEYIQQQNDLTIGT